MTTRAPVQETPPRLRSNVEVGLAGLTQTACAELFHLRTKGQGNPTVQFLARKSGVRLMVLDWRPAVA
jgi:hypothetical protein